MRGEVVEPVQWLPTRRGLDPRNGVTTTSKPPRTRPTTYPHLVPDSLPLLAKRPDRETGH